MPQLLTNLFLFVGGAIVGSLVNWAIYSFGYFRQRPISPWGAPDPSAPARNGLDRIPIVGWFGLRRESGVHGKLFWIRPLLIELALACFAVWFWHWQFAGGLMGNQLVPPADNAELWFAAHSLLIALLVIATFIDFDEKTIPDWVTLPGTLIGLTFAIVAPSFHLPEILANAARGLYWQPLDYASPNKEQEMLWPLDWRGLAIGVGVILAWSWALLPKITTTRWGLFRGFRIMMSSVIRPKRKTKCAIRVDQRRPFALTWLILVMAFLLSIVVVVVWFGFGNDPRWTSLLSSLLGMAMGGGLVWVVRLIASTAMGQEAMGFGDVTLMTMIGAFLGWQASLMVFAFAPFAALAIALIQFTLTRNREIAFGPYLALATVVVLVRWSPTWNENARDGIFLWPELLLGVLAASLMLMGLMLGALRWMRGGEAE